MWQGQDGVCGGLCSTQNSKEERRKAVLSYLTKYYLSKSSDGNFSVGNEEGGPVSEIIPVASKKETNFNISFTTKPKLLESSLIAEDELDSTLPPPTKPSFLSQIPLYSRDEVLEVTRGDSAALSTSQSFSGSAKNFPKRKSSLRDNPKEMRGSSVRRGKRFRKKVRDNVRTLLPPHNSYYPKKLRKEEESSFGNGTFPSPVSGKQEELSGNRVWAKRRQLFRAAWRRGRQLRHGHRRETSKEGSLPEDGRRLFPGSKRRPPRPVGALSDSDVGLGGRRVGSRRRLSRLHKSEKNTKLRGSRRRYHHPTRHKKARKDSAKNWASKSRKSELRGRKSGKRNTSFRRKKEKVFSGNGGDLETVTKTVGDTLSGRKKKSKIGTQSAPGEEKSQKNEEIAAITRPITIARVKTSAQARTNQAQPINQNAANHNGEEIIIESPDLLAGPESKAEVNNLGTIATTQHSNIHFLNDSISLSFSGQEVYVEFMENATTKAALYDGTNKTNLQPYMDVIFGERIDSNSSTNEDYFTITSKPKNIGSKNNNKSASKSIVSGARTVLPDTLVPPEEILNRTEPSDKAKLNNESFTNLVNKSSENNFVYDSGNNVTDIFGAFFDNVDYSSEVLTTESYLDFPNETYPNSLTNETFHFDTIIKNIYYPMPNVTFYPHVTPTITLKGDKIKKYYTASNETSYDGISNSSIYNFSVNLRNSSDTGESLETVLESPVSIGADDFNEGVAYSTETWVDPEFDQSISFLDKEIHSTASPIQEVTSVYPHSANDNAHTEKTEKVSVTTLGSFFLWQYFRPNEKKLNTSSNEIELFKKFSKLPQDYKVHFAQKIFGIHPTTWSSKRKTSENTTEDPHLLPTTSNIGTTLENFEDEQSRQNMRKLQRLLQTQIESIVFPVPEPKPMSIIALENLTFRKYKGLKDFVPKVVNVPETDFVNVVHPLFKGRERKTKRLQHKISEHNTSSLSKEVERLPAREGVASHNSERLPETTPSDEEINSSPEIAAFPIAPVALMKPQDIPVLFQAKSISQRQVLIPTSKSLLQKNLESNSSGEFQISVNLNCSVGVRSLTLCLILPVIILLKSWSVLE